MSCEESKNITRALKATLEISNVNNNLSRNVKRVSNFSVMKAAISLMDSWKLISVFSPKQGWYITAHRERKFGNGFYCEQVSFIFVTSWLSQITVSSYLIACHQDFAGESEKGRALNLRDRNVVITTSVGCWTVL